MERVIKPVFISCLFIGMFLLYGCAVQGDASAETEKNVLFERVDSEDAHISKVETYEDGNSLVVSGKVKRNSYNCCESVRGHIDIAVLGPGGELLDLVSASYSPRNIPKSGAKASSFNADLGYVPPEQAKIRIRYHSDKDGATYAGITTKCLEGVVNF